MRSGEHAARHAGLLMQRDSGQVEEDEGNIDDSIDILKTQPELNPRGRSYFNLLRLFFGLFARFVD